MLEINFLYYFKFERKKKKGIDNKFIFVDVYIKGLYKNINIYF